MSLPLITEKAKEVNSGSAHYPSSRYVEAYNHYNRSNISMIGQQNRSKPIPQKDVPYAQLHNPCFCKNIPISGWNDPLIDPMVVSPSCIEKDVHINTHTYISGWAHSQQNFIGYYHLQLNSSACGLTACPFQFCIKTQFPVMCLTTTILITYALSFRYRMLVPSASQHVLQSHFKTVGLHFKFCITVWDNSICKTNSNFSEVTLLLIEYSAIKFTWSLLGNPYTRYEWNWPEKTSNCSTDSACLLKSITRVQWKRVAAVSPLSTKGKSNNEQMSLSWKSWPFTENLQKLLTYEHTKSYPFYYLYTVVSRITVFSFLALKMAESALQLDTILRQFQH